MSPGVCPSFKLRLSNEEIPVVPSDWSLTGHENLKPGNNQSGTRNGSIGSSIGNFLRSNRRRLLDQQSHTAIAYRHETDLCKYSCVINNEFSQLESKQSVEQVEHK